MSAFRKSLLVLTGVMLGVQAHSSFANGVDTPAGVTDLPLLVEGVQILDLTQSGVNSSQPLTVNGTVTVNGPGSSVTIDSDDIWVTAPGPNADPSLYLQRSNPGTPVIVGTLYNLNQGHPNHLIVFGGIETWGALTGWATPNYGATPQIFVNGDNHYGGGIAVSDDGGFFDYNDNWVTFNGSTGLRIAGINGPGSGGYGAGGDLIVNNRMATNGLNPDDLPGGWSGGLRTLDVYASGTVAVGPGGNNFYAYINSSGLTVNQGGIQLNGNSINNVFGGVGVGNVGTGWYSDGDNLAARFPQGSGSGGFFVQTPNGGTTYMVSGPNIGGTWFPTGNVTATNYVYAQAFLQTSDARLKTNIKTSKGLEIIEALRGVTFDWKNGSGSSSGILAQDVEKVMPNAVQTVTDGHKVVDYSQLISPMIEAIKELKAENDELRAEIHHQTP